MSGAFVYGYDEGLGFDVAYQYSTNGGSLFTTTDANGAFALTVPVLTGLTLTAYNSGESTNNVLEFLSGTSTTVGCPTSIVTIEADWWRTFFILDNSQNNIGGLYQYQGIISAYLSIGTTYYFGRLAPGVQAQFPSQPGQSLGLDLYQISTGGVTKIGTIIFTATSSLGGTWQTTGVSFSGTWGN